MNPEAVYVACAIWAVFGLWRVGTALHAIAAAVKVAMPREVNLRHQREREPWENN